MTKRLLKVIAQGMLITVCLPCILAIAFIIVTYEGGFALADWILD